MVPASGADSIGRIRTKCVLGQQREFVVGTDFPKPIRRGFGIVAKPAFAFPEASSARLRSAMTMSFLDTLSRSLRGGRATSEQFQKTWTHEDAADQAVKCATRTRSFFTLAEIARSRPRAHPPNGGSKHGPEGMPLIEPPSTFLRRTAAGSCCLRGGKQLQFLAPLSVHSSYALRSISAPAPTRGHSGDGITWADDTYADAAYP